MKRLVFCPIAISYRIDPYHERVLMIVELDNFTSGKTRVPLKTVIFFVVCHVTFSAT